MSLNPARSLRRRQLGVRAGDSGGGLFLHFRPRVSRGRIGGSEAWGTFYPLLPGLRRPVVAAAVANFTPLQSVMVVAGLPSREEREMPAGDSETPRIRIHYERTDVLTPKELQAALQLSDKQWERKRHVFPWSRALGTRTLRVTWGQVLEVLEGKRYA